MNSTLAKKIAPSPSNDASQEGSPPIKLQKKKRDREATTQKLLEAGLEVFSQLGYDGATTKMIAKTAGIAEALIIRYFGGKEGLLFAIFLSYVEKRKAAEEIYPEGESLVEEIKNFLFFSLERDLKEKDFLRVLTSRAAVDPKFNQRLRENVPIDVPSTLLKRLQQYQQKGDISKGINLQEVCFNLGFQGFSTLYLGNMVLQMPIETIRAGLNSFAEIYASGLQTWDPSKKSRF
jgi:AcrR family transcriptional regulator